MPLRLGQRCAHSTADFSHMRLYHTSLPPEWGVVRQPVALHTLKQVMGSCMFLVTWRVVGGLRTLSAM